MSAQPEDRLPTRDEALDQMADAYLEVWNDLPPAEQVRINEAAQRAAS